MKTVRCAIYTRKSSDEGLEQDFNSLDAQREACAAYILSQASEGWQLIPAHYDDGGMSGGTLERPALQRLLADVAEGQIDIVVIYKIDRLTRSLLDFAKLVEVFEKKGTSFVAVTQSFNTTNSMGRLTLNMLLSFAQFEREVTAERIRDKLAASKAKGMWMGGVPPLGYAPEGRSLKIVEAQAELIRDIYARYRKLKNVRLVADELKAEGVLIPPRTLGSGRQLGTGPFSRGQIYAILKNPIYAGNIAHRGNVHQGMHEPIIALEEWEVVQRQLEDNLQGVRSSNSAHRSALAGRLFDEAGEPLIATHAAKSGRRYRYYVTKALHHGERRGPGAGIRVPAGEIETAVAGELASLFDDPLALIERCQLHVEPAKLNELIRCSGEMADQLRGDALWDYRDLMDRIEVHDGRIDIVLATKAVGDALGIPLSPLASKTFAISKAMQLTRSGRAVRLIHGDGVLASRQPTDPALVQLVMRAQKWWSILREGKLNTTQLAEQEGVVRTYIVRVVRIAFLAPQVIDAIFAGRLKNGVTAKMLYKPDVIPLSWEQQVQRFVATG
ncbi:recombinase family protein [Novosphingobium sp. PS1R-30]|uniref:Recombinase family protein n=1 Tax=Novosphingobium anseongense TaxID=3133436 RepID=A0ABU8S2N0_9SPHN